MAELDSRDWRGHEVVDRDGDKVGEVDDLLVDAGTGRAEWAILNTGLLGMSSTLVPLAGATVGEDERIRVAYDKGLIDDAPGLEPTAELSERQEAELYRHYGMSSTSSSQATEPPASTEPRAPASTEPPAPASTEPRAPGSTEPRAPASPDRDREERELREREAELRAREQRIEVEERDEREREKEERREELEARERELQEREAALEDGDTSDAPAARRLAPSEERQGEPAAGGPRLRRYGAERR